MKKIFLFLAILSALNTSAQVLAPPRPFTSSTDNLLLKVLGQLGGVMTNPINVDTNNRISVKLDSIIVNLRDSIQVYSTQLEALNNSLNDLSPYVHTIAAAATQYNNFAVSQANPSEGLLYVANAFHRLEAQVITGNMEIYINDVPSAVNIPAGGRYVFEATNLIVQKFEFKTDASGVVVVISVTP